MSKDNNNNDGKNVIRLAAENIMSGALQNVKNSEDSIPSWHVSLKNGESFQFTGQLAAVSLLAIVDENHQPFFMTSWDNISYLLRIENPDAEKSPA